MYVQYRTSSCPDQSSVASCSTEASSHVDFSDCSGEMDESASDTDSATGSDSSILSQSLRPPPPPPNCLLSSLSPIAGRPQVSRLYCRATTVDVWALKPVIGHQGKRIRFLFRGFNKPHGVEKICNQHINYIAQQVVWSTPVFRGGGVFSLRGHALLTFMSEMKLMWNNRTGTFILFAHGPNGRIGHSARYLTNEHARRLAPGESLADFSTPAACEFDRLGPGAWGTALHHS